MRRYEHGGAYHQDIRLDFSVNLNPMGMPEEVTSALRQGLDACSAYPDPQCSALREALAACHGVRPENVLCGNGAAGLLFSLCACLRPSRALVSAPTFSEYQRSAELFGGQVEEIPLPLGAAFFSALQPGLDLVFLCSPNNPTGELLPPALLQETARRCRDIGAVFVADESFLDFTEGNSLLPLLKDCPNLLILKAFTKFYAMAGLRLGYLLGEHTLLSRIALFAPPWSVSAPAQTAGLAALSVPPTWGEETRRLVRGERRFLAEALTALGLTVFPSDANFLLLKSQHPLYQPLKQRGILVRDCSNFTGLDERYIRIGLKTREENLQLLQAIREVLHG